MAENAASSTGSDVSSTDSQGVRRWRPRKADRQRVTELPAETLRVAVDMMLGDHMNRKEIARLVNQVQRLYGSNLRNPDPVRVHLTGLEPTGVIYRECIKRCAGFLDWPVLRTPLPHHEYLGEAHIIYFTPDAAAPLLKLDESAIGGGCGREGQDQAVVGRL